MSEVLEGHKIAAKGAVLAAVVSGLFGLAGGFLVGKRDDTSPAVSQKPLSVPTSGVPDGLVYFGLRHIDDGRQDFNFVSAIDGRVVLPVAHSLFRVTSHEMRVRPITLDSTSPEASWPAPIFTLQQNDVIEVAEVREYNDPKGRQLWVRIQPAK